MIPCHVGFNDCWHECSNLETVPFGTRCVPRFCEASGSPASSKDSERNSRDTFGSGGLVGGLASFNFTWTEPTCVSCACSPHCQVWRLAHSRRADTSLADPSLSVLSCRCAGGTLAGAWRRRNAHRRGGTSGASWTNLYLLVMGRLSRN